MYFIFAKRFKCFKCFKVVNLRFLNDNAMKKTPLQKELLASCETISEICNTLKVSLPPISQAFHLKNNPSKLEPYGFLLSKRTEC